MRKAIRGLKVALHFVSARYVQLKEYKNEQLMIEEMKGAKDLLKRCPFK